jgi:lipopolysaccharide transport system permease protein
MSNNSNSLKTILNQTVIRPKKGWQFIDWRELREYKDLFFFLVWRDIKIIYKQTILGFSWAIIRPVFSMIVFSIVFGRLAKVPSDGIPYPIFAFTALLPWTYFSTALSKSSLSLISSANMLTKVYFPRIIIPFTPVLAGLVDFAIAFTILIGMMAWYAIIPTINILFLPMLIVLMILTAAGVGMWLSAMAIQYRDIKHAITFVVQLLMYAAIEGFRASLLGKNPMPWDLILIGTLSAILIALSGAFYFRRMERIFADVA